MHLNLKSAPISPLTRFSYVFYGSCFAAFSTAVNQDLSVFCKENNTRGYRFFQTFSRLRLRASFSFCSYPYCARLKTFYVLFSSFPRQGALLFRFTAARVRLFLFPVCFSHSPRRGVFFYLSSLSRGLGNTFIPICHSERSRGISWKRILSSSPRRGVSVV